MAEDEKKEYSEGAQDDVAITMTGEVINASGHRDQLSRQYGLLSICGLALTVDNAWIAIGTSLSLSICKSTPHRLIQTTNVHRSQRWSSWRHLRVPGRRAILRVHQFLHCRGSHPWLSPNAIEVLVNQVCSTEANVGINSSQVQYHRRAVFTTGPQSRQDREMEELWASLQAP